VPFPRYLVKDQLDPAFGLTTVLLGRG
jgi:hypothetical protein